MLIQGPTVHAEHRGTGRGRDLGCLEGVMAKEERGLAAQQALRLPSPFGWVNVTAEVILGSGQR